MSRRLAVISPNCRKYSETFIHAQIDALPFDLLLYSEGFLPTVISRDRGVGFEEIPVRNKWYRSRKTPADALRDSFREENVGVVLVQYGPTGVEVLDVCREAGIPLIVHFHGYDAYRQDVLSTQGKKYAELFEYASALIVVSKDMSRQLIRLGAPEAKIREVHYGVDTIRFCPAQLGGDYLLYCGRFVPKKHPLQAIRAFADAFVGEAMQFRMIGDGELMNDAQELVMELGLEERVLFEGVCSPDEVIRLMQGARALVLPSGPTADNDSEGTPLAILEASACGIPVISTQHAGIPEAVIDGQTGILVAPGDVKAMVDAMKKISGDQEMAARMGQAGREHILAHFSLTGYLESLTEIVTATEIQKLS